MITAGYLPVGKDFPVFLHPQTREEYAANFGRLGVNFDLHGGWQAFPMLVERTERVCCETNCAYGGYTNARDLARLYSAVLAQLQGASDPALPSAATLSAFCSRARACTYDSVLQRECEFGLGFMTNLVDHRFGVECSPESFGHSGNVSAGGSRDRCKSKRGQRDSIRRPRGRLCRPAGHD